MINNIVIKYFRIDNNRYGFLQKKLLFERNKRYNVRSEMESVFKGFWTGRGSNLRKGMEQVEAFADK